MNLFKKITMIFHPRLLRLVKVVELEACDGKVDVSLLDKVFAIASSLFRKLMVVVGLATPKTKVAVYELRDDVKFVDAFASLSSDFEKMCLTQAQIIEFCRNHSNDLSREGAIFFLFKGNDKRFVAYVNVLSDGLFARAYHFENVVLWGAGHCGQLVVLQL
jgi:hypothetical protein